MSYAKLCDFCGAKIPMEITHKTNPIPVKLRQVDHTEYDLCTWDCVIGYAMARGGVDRGAPRRKEGS
jgi:hypothetical protein